jgi:hypothetical protein
MVQDQRGKNKMWISKIIHTYAELFEVQVFVKEETKRRKR